MGDRLKSSGLRSLTACYFVSLVWLGHVLTASVLIAFRAMKHAGISNAFDFKDVPPLRFLDLHYDRLYMGLAASSVAVLLAVFAGIWWGFRRRNPLSRRWLRDASRGQLEVLSGLFALAVFETCVLWACAPTEYGTATSMVAPIAGADWSAILAVALCGWSLPVAMTRACRTDDSATPLTLIRPPQTSWIIRNGMAYVLGCAGVVLYAVQDHLKFWNPEKNGGYVFEPFFAEGEISQANLVLYSTSVLFASLAAIGGCVTIGLFRAVIRWQNRKNDGYTATGSDTQGRLLTVLSAVVWSAVLMIPWQTKLWPEIEAERGWILPTVTIVFTAVALIPLLQVGWLSFRADFHWLALRRLQNAPSVTPFIPRDSELAVWNFVLFPVSPVLRVFRSGGAACLSVVAMLAAGGAIYGLTELVAYADKKFTFEDWRDMMRSGLFPFLRVVFAMLAACWVYIVMRRMALAATVRLRPRPVADGSQPPKRDWLVFLFRPMVFLLASANLALATWPFWGWQNVNQNVFARTVEFSDRHVFEIRFLHWIFDYDRDGYSAVLHGADPDDFDADVRPAHILPPRDDNPVPIDEFEIVNLKKSLNFPSVMLLYLEGVVPRSISAYGQRRVVGTPHMDAIAREGTLFTQARCFYPSTWDAWYSTCSGRFLRIQEMDMAQPFGDRYSRYSNLYKVMKLAGINRWCHSDVSPFRQLIAPPAMHGHRDTDWMPDYDTSLSGDEEKRGILRGDKRNQRMLDFLDSLRPGERFFVTEHMSDTHFPWNKTSLERARELGFPDGIDWAEADADLPNGTRTENYSNYYQTITRMDGQIGQLVNKLKEKGLYDNTIIIIVSDHGCQWWEHEHMYYVSHLYDQSLLVPMIIRVPGLNTVRKVDEPTLQVDILQTVVELAGARHTNPRDDYPFTGRSLVPLMNGTATDNIRRSFWKRDVPLTTHYDKLGVISDFRYKLIFDRPVGTYRLFDLINDPKEMHNLADEKPDILQEMVQKLKFQINQNPAIIGGIKRADPLETAKKRALSFIGLGE